MGFCNKLERLSLVSFFQSSLINTLAYYENPLITDKKVFITFAPDGDGRLVETDADVVEAVELDLGGVVAEPVND